MLRRFIRYLINTSISEQRGPVLISLGVSTIEWRLWEVPEPSEATPAGWYKVTNEPYTPSRWEAIAGLIGSGEQTPLAYPAEVYRQSGHRHYIVELAYTKSAMNAAWPSELRDALLATGWRALPADARRITVPTSFDAAF